jgi:hypothetical protein
MSEFMGKNGFQWFVGVVEDRQDPKTLGRLRVRCLGYHTENLDKLPTKDLPWSHVMNPITSATVSGLGQTPLGAVEGTWVVGFFQDGADAQQPIIIGTLPGVPSELPTKIEKGDDDKYPGNGFQDYINAVYPKYKEESDVNRLAVNDEDLPHSSLTIRKADRTKDIGRADFNEVQAFMSELDNQTIAGDDGTAFSEPEVPHNTTYPYNHVYESEAGHIREMDDTPDHERIHERHASGSGYEIHPDGSKVTRVKKDNYDLIYGQQYTHIRGNQSTTTNGGVKVFVNAAGAGGRDALTQYHYTIQVGKNANVNIQVDKGDVNVVTTDGDINLKSGKDIVLDAAQGIRLKSKSLDSEQSGDWNETTLNKTENTTAHTMKSKTTALDGDTSVNITGGRIDLN